MNYFAWYVQIGSINIVTLNNEYEGNHYNDS